MKIEFFELVPRIDTTLSVGVQRCLKDVIEAQATRLHTKPGILARNLLIKGLIASGASREALGVVNGGEL